MINKDFYPTPSFLAYKMAYMTCVDRNSFVLEPSAGKGDLAQAIVSAGARKERVHCVEIEPELRDVLKGKGFRVVGSDFLEFSADADYDAIIANFPFSDGADHFLKAWEILKEGTIVCLLNAETLKNPHSEKRKTLAKIIEDNGGQVEYIENAFAEAERKTGVSVALVRVEKKKAASGWFEGTSFEREEFKEAEAFTERGLQSSNALSSIVAEYEHAKRLYAEGLATMKRAQKIASRISDAYDIKVFEIANDRTEKEAIEEFASRFKRGVWSKVVNSTGAEKFMTSKVREEFERHMKQHGDMSITKKNIEDFIHYLYSNAGSIMEGTIQEVFDTFTKYHKENRVHYEGWKTNECWKVGKKIILPNVVECMFDGRMTINYSYRDRVNDIDKVMAFLSGKHYDSVRGIVDSMKGKGFGEKFDSEFFTVKCFMKGTVHIEFKDEWLMDEFNKRATTGRGWLPPETRKRKTTTSLAITC